MSIPLRFICVSIVCCPRAFVSLLSQFTSPSVRYFPTASEAKSARISSRLLRHAISAVLRWCPPSHCFPLLRSVVARYWRGASSGAPHHIGELLSQSATTDTCTTRTFTPSSRTPSHCTRPQHAHSQQTCSPAHLPPSHLDRTPLRRVNLHCEAYNTSHNIPHTASMSFRYTPPHQKTSHLIPHLHTTHLKLTHSTHLLTR